jgi:hypothetical protein
MSEVVDRSVLDAVGEDTDITPEEKETTLRLGKVEDEATIYTAEAGISRRILAHPDIEILGLTVAEGDARREISVDEHDNEDIVGVRGSVPVGALSVRSSPRSSTGHADIVSDRVLGEVEQ